jgi:uncharacterized membrane protein
LPYRRNGETGATVGTATLKTTHTSAGTYASASWSLSQEPWTSYVAFAVSFVFIGITWAAHHDMCRHHGLSTCTISQSSRPGR